MTQKSCKYRFSTVRAKVERASKQLQQLKQEKKILFGPGFKAALRSQGNNGV